MLDRTKLALQFDRGERPRIVLFWGHGPSRRGAAGPHVLSNWWPSAFEVSGVRYPTAEHWLMAGKARIFGDEASEQDILSEPDPAAAKQMGRLVRGFDAARWDASRVGLMREGLVAKFQAHAQLQAYLVSTRNAVLVEASPSDAVWGIALPATDPRAQDPRKWRGENLLGFVLMDVREELQRAVSAAPRVKASGSAPKRGRAARSARSLAR